MFDIKMVNTETDMRTQQSSQCAMHERYLGKCKMMLPFSLKFSCLENPVIFIIKVL